MMQTARPSAVERWRRPGCDARCVLARAIRPGTLDRVSLELHDPEAHEEYGRLSAGPFGELAVVWTHSLVIDRWRRTVVSQGAPVALSGRLWEILDYLAVRLDRFCPTTEIVGAIWGAWSEPHTQHVFLARLRAALGPNAALIETRPSHGYRLCAEPAVEVAPSAPIAPVSPFGAWSQRAARCVCCGSTARPHEGYGRCSRCRMRPDSRRQHYGPCAAPPASLEDS